MKVRCVSNTGADLPASALDEAGGFRRDTIFDISVGGDYVVYALTLKDGHVWYYICDDRRLPYPVWHPAALFSVVDQRLSRYWVFAHGSRDRAGDIIFAFPDWANNALAFYDRLSDGEPGAVETFRRYKRMMDVELAIDQD